MITKTMLSSANERECDGERESEYRGANVCHKINVQKESELIVVNELCMAK